MASLTSAAARYSEGVAGMEDYRSPWKQQPDQPAPSSSGAGGLGSGEAHTNRNNGRAGGVCVSLSNFQVAVRMGSSMDPWVH